LSESPSGNGFSEVPTSPGSTRSTARSLDWSVPRTSARTERPLSSKRTLTCDVPSTTCALVTIDPSPSMTKPVPEPAPLRTCTTPFCTAA
jgi:hypothetical protein